MGALPVVPALHCRHGGSHDALVVLARASWPTTPLTALSARTTGWARYPEERRPVGAHLLRAIPRRVGVATLEACDVCLAQS